MLRMAEENGWNTVHVHFPTMSVSVATYTDFWHGEAAALTSAWLPNCPSVATVERCSFREQLRMVQPLPRTCEFCSLVPRPPHVFSSSFCLQYNTWKWKSTLFCYWTQIEEQKRGETWERGYEFWEMNFMRSPLSSACFVESFVYAFIIARAK